MQLNSFLKVLLLTASILLLSDHALANPLTEATVVKDDDIIKESLEEVNDLNVAIKALSSGKSEEEAEKSTAETHFSHRDEDMPRVEQKLNTNIDKSLNYDFEMLETRDIKKENVEIEERFRGAAALKINTDTFIAENIEVNGGEDAGAAGDAIQQSHMILTIILVIVALMSIGLYAALVIWRSHLEQRYGMRELLVSNDDDDDFHRHSNNSNVPHSTEA